MWASLYSRCVDKMNLDEEVLLNYRLSRKMFLEGNIDMAVFWYRKNRADHGCDIYYEVDLPEHIKFVHPVGSVLGRATYGDYFCAYHNVTVGSSIDHEYPVLGTGVVLFGGARIIGPTRLGNNVLVQTDTTVMGADVPDNSVVFPADNKQRCAWKPTKRSVVERFFT